MKNAKEECQCINCQMARELSMIGIRIQPIDDRDQDGQLKEDRAKCDLDKAQQGANQYSSTEQFTGSVGIINTVEDVPGLKGQIGGDYYKTLAIQPVEYCFKNNIPAIEAAVIKYVTRHRSKGGAKDIKKAIHLLTVLMELQYK